MPPVQGPLGSLARVSALAMGVAATGLGTPAHAQPAPPDRQARVWAAACSACHAENTRAAGSIPVLAGRDAPTLLRSLLEFKNNQRPAATVMHQHAKGYTDDELRRIAQFLASQPAP